MEAEGEGDVNLETGAYLLDVLVVFFIARSERMFTSESNVTTGSGKS